jgi:hypothetical protein
MLYLFIASPGSLTPFHIDRYSTFLLQFQGSKTVTVWPPWDERVVSAADVEGFCWFQGLRPAWRPESEPLGVRFAFGPGEALHIPFVAPHLVQNGPGEVSVSMSIIFKTARTEQQLRALRFNLTARKVLARVGATPAAIGHGGWRDSAKAAAISAVRVVRRRPG